MMTLAGHAIPSRLCRMDRPTIQEDRYSIQADVDLIRAARQRHTRISEAPPEPTIGQMLEPMLVGVIVGLLPVVLFMWAFG